MIIWLQIFVFVLSGVWAETICLNMIVKDEKPVIERCLNSVKGTIDYWVIVDTGSTDGTQEVIRECMKGIPGELYERPWVNFGHNRNEALKLAQGKGDYFLFIDADEVWQSFSSEVRPKNLTADAYYVLLSGDPQAHRGSLVKSGLDWKWHGALHEQLRSKEVGKVESLEGFMIVVDLPGGHRSEDPQKWDKDIATLEKAVLDEPENSDYVFYLAQSYLNGKNYGKALENYLKRAEMGGWDELVFWSLYVAGKMQENLKYPEDEILKTYNRAYLSRPTRVEPVFEMSRMAFEKGQYLTAYLLAQHGMSFKVPDDHGFIQRQIYDYGVLIYLADSAHKLGRNKEAFLAWERLIKVPSLPPHFKERVSELIAVGEENL